MPPGILTGTVDEVGSTRWTIIGRDRVTSGDVYAAATPHAGIPNDGRALRTDIEVVSREVAQGFKLFVQEVLVDYRLTAVARFHDDAPPLR